MFSPDVEDHSFSPNRKIERSKRKLSYKTLSDAEESEISSAKAKRSFNKKNDSSLKNSRLSNGTVSGSTNNSLSHPALSGKKAGISHSTPINDVRLTPTKGRRSLIVDKFVLQDDDEINDDAEELRVERENQISAQDSTLESEKGLKSLEILAHCLDTELSTEQLAAHLASCIELNAANKININNAFNLKLIDYMIVLLKRNDKTMKDFPTMSCTLDASSRIYACRVDNVHAGVLEIVTGLAATSNKQRKMKSKDPENQNDGRESGGDDDDDDNEDDERAKRRSKKRKAVLASSEKVLSRNTIELAHWMTRKAIEPNFTVLFNSAKMTQSSNAGLSLLKDSVKLIPEKTPATKASQENPTIDIDLPVLVGSSPSLLGRSFQFNWDEEAEEQQSQNSMLNEVDCENEMIRSNESGMVNNPPEAESFALGSPDIPADHCDDDDDDDRGDIMPDEPEPDDNELKPLNGDDMIPFDKLSEAERRCESKQNKKRKTHLDALNLINSKMILADDENDYSYVNTDVLPLMWAGPDHWKPVLKRGKSTVAVAECAEKKMKKIKKKSPEGLNYDDFSMIDSIYSKKVNAMLQSKAVKKWAEAKVTYPIQKEFKTNILYRSFLRKTLFWKPLVKTDKDGDELKVETEYMDDMEDDSEDNLAADGNSILPEFDNFDRDDQESVPDNQSDDGDFEDNILEPELQQETMGAPQTSEELISNELVPVPRMVNCGTISYATVPKRVNMKKLKETCWCLMDFESDKENQNQNSLQDNCGKTVQFSNLYLELPKHLPADSRNDLSPALAFLSILHLANEKMLHLCPVDKEFDKESNSDFLIKRAV